MKRVLVFCFWAGCIMALAAGCAAPAGGGASTSPVSDTATVAAPTPTTLGPFDYDATVPFDIQIQSETERDGVTVVDLSYAAHDPSFSTSTGGRTMVYLVKPQGDGPFAGMIYMHWFGQGNSNRGQYLEEAVEMAKRGVVCLLPQGYFPWMTMPTGEPDWPLVIGQVQELRRAVDFLLSQPGVDPNRIGYAGHNYGAAYGGILAGVDHRVKAYVFVAGASRFGYWLTYFGYQIDFYGSAMEDLDPIQYLPNAAPANLFFQFPENDAFVPKEAADEFFNAASEPKKIEWYTDIQEMGSPAVRQAREEWLIEQLGLQ